MPVRDVSADVVRRSKGFVRRTANRAGLEISADPYLARVVRVLRLLDVGWVIDVGANEGQFGRDLRAMGYDGAIVSLEPLAAPFARLERAARKDPRWWVVRAAASDVHGEALVHVAGNSVSSSVLPMLASHADAEPRSRYVADETVPATTVDLIVAQHDIEPASALLKVDVQGFESSVLDGAAETLSGFAAVQLELSFVALYEGQSLISDLVGRLDRLGFVLWVLMPEFADPGTGRTLQCDGLFVHRRRLASKGIAP